MWQRGLTRWTSSRSSTTMWGSGGEQTGGAGARGKRTRTQVVVDEAEAAVASEIGVPAGNGLDPAGEGARGADVGGEGEAERAEQHGVCSEE